MSTHLHGIPVDILHFIYAKENREEFLIFPQMHDNILI